MASDERMSPLGMSDVARAIELYLATAYGETVPEAIRERFLVPECMDLPTWLMTDVAERSPAEASFEDVRSFALRIGNAMYPHMKLRLSRPPGWSILILSVDAHDAMLQAPEGSADAAVLETLKANNARMVSEIMAAWEEAGLPTEKTFLRGQIEHCRQEMDKDTPS